jgi:hypothetical protein
MLHGLRFLDIRFVTSLMLCHAAQRAAVLSNAMHPAACSCQAGQYKVDGNFAVRLSRATQGGVAVLHRDEMLCHIYFNKDDSGVFETVPCKNSTTVRVI